MTDQPQYPEYPGEDRPETPGQRPPPPPGYQPPPPPGYQPPPPDYPPPPPGYYPTPPGYGQQPPGQGYAYPGGPARPYAGWWVRVGASLLDGLIVLGVILVPFIVGAVIAFKDAETDPVSDEVTGVNGAGVAILVLTGVLYFAFDIWNRGIRVGTKGQSIGKRIVGIHIVKDRDNELLGAGGGFLRWLMTFLFGVVTCVQLLDVLWPLWDEKNQTLHDKVVGSVPLKS